jgi:hypothetical protein
MRNPGKVIKKNSSPAGIEEMRKALVGQKIVSIDHNPEDADCSFRLTTDNNVLLVAGFSYQEGAVFLDTYELDLLAPGGG